MGSLGQLRHQATAENAPSTEMNEASGLRKARDTPQAADSCHDDSCHHPGSNEPMEDAASRGRVDIDPGRVTDAADPDVQDRKRDLRSDRDRDPGEARYDAEDESGGRGSVANGALTNGKSPLPPAVTSSQAPDVRSAPALRRQTSVLPPDGGWGWVVVGGSFLAFFLSGGLSRSFTLIYQHMLEVFGQSAAATSATAALFGAVKMCTSPLVSMMCVKFSKRVIAVLGGLITSVAMVLTSFPLSLPYVYFTYGVMAAFGINMILTPIFIIISEYFKKRRARAMSLAMLGASFGGVGLPPLITMLFHQYDYSGAMLILAGLMFHLCLTGAVFRPVRYRDRKSGTDVNQNPAPCEEQALSDEEDDEEDDDEEEDDEDEDGEDDDGDGRTYDGAYDPDGRNDVSDGEAPDPDADRPECGARGRDGSAGARAEEGTLYASGGRKVSSAVTFDDPSRRDSSGSASGSAYPEGLGPRYVSHYERIARMSSRRRVSFHVGGVRLAAAERTSCSTTDTDYGLRAACPCLNRCLSYFGVRLLRQPTFVLYSLLMAGSILSLSVSGTFLSGLVLDLGFDETHTGIMLSASALAAIPSRSLSGIVFDLKRARPYRSLLLTGLGFLTGAFSLSMGLCAGYVELFVTYVIYSFFASAYHTHHATVLADIVRRRDVSRAMGLCRLFQGIGFIIGPISGGYIRDATGHYANAYLFSGAVLVTFTLLYTAVEVSLRRRRKLRQKRHLPKGYVARCRADSIWSNI